MIDPQIEHLISIREAAKLPELQRNGRAVHFSSVWRWIIAGRLESITVGGMRLTSREAVQRMIAAANPALTYSSTPAQRERELSKIERELKDLGI